MQSTLMDTTQQKKAHEGGRIVRENPYYMQLFDYETLIREVFQRVGCINFCQKMQRRHPEVAREFALNFDGTKTKVRTLECEVYGLSISEKLRYLTLVRDGSRP
jgi:hypothetical protein